VDWNLTLKVVVAVAPVILAMLLFDRFDLFDLVSFRTLFIMLLVGAGLAAASYGANISVMDALPIGFSNYSKYVAPVVEEAIKGAFIVVLFTANRIGFKLDAAVIGFAVGAGFSVFENGYYLYHSPEANVGVWVVRGFGTAMMHAGATALFAVISHEFTERQAQGRTFFFNPLLFLPGLAAAALVHGTFNHFPNQPLPDMLGALLLIPATLFLVFSKSEKATHMWLAADFENHKHALDEIRSGRFAQSDTGKKLTRLARGFRKAAATDIFDYVALKTELVLRAEEVLLDREDGDRPEVGEPELSGFARLRDLEERIGRAVLRAIRPHLFFSRNDDWELRRLEEFAHGAVHGKKHKK
jgi:RsiW-degrading membrane proteinase PrsW (M82 family)